MTNDQADWLARWALKMQNDGGFSVGLRRIERGLELIICYSKMSRVIAWLQQMGWLGWLGWLGCPSHLDWYMIDDLVLMEVNALAGKCIQQVYFSHEEGPGHLIGTDVHWLVPYDGATG